MLCLTVALLPHMLNLLKISSCALCLVKFIVLSLSKPGNEIIHQLTRNGNVTLYVAITLVNGTTLYQVYRRFSVADESDKFRLFLQEPADGNLGLYLYSCLQVLSYRLTKLINELL